MSVMWDVLDRRTGEVIYVNLPSWFTNRSMRWEVFYNRETGEVIY